MGALEELGQAAETLQRAAGQGALLNFLNASEPEVMVVWELESSEHPESSAACGLKGCWGTASLVHSTEGDMKKGSLGQPLKPPICKAGSPLVSSAAGSLRSSLQRDFQESREMRPGSSSRRQEKDSDHSGLTGYPIAKNLPQIRPSSLLPSKPSPGSPERSSSFKPSKMYNEEKEKCKASTGYKDIRRNSQELSSDGESCQDPAAEDKRKTLTIQSDRDLHELLLPLPGLPPSQAKEMDHPTSPGLMSDSDLRDSFGRVRPALCKLAQKNLERKKIELLQKELKRRRQNETSLQLPSQTVKPGDAAEATFSLPLVDGTTPSVQRKHPGSALKKKVMRKQDNVPLLPNKPIIHGGGSFPRNSSVTLQTATGAERRDQPRRGKWQKDTASSDPQQSLQEALSLLGSDDWEVKEKALVIIKDLAESHSEVLLCRLREICLAVTSEVTNLRSKVSYYAMITLGELFAILRKDMDSEVDEIAPVLLHMVWNSPAFVQKAACQALGSMVENVTPARAMTVLMDSGVKSRYVQVRKCAAELLLSLMEKMGVTKLAGTPRAEMLAHVAGTLAQDCHQDTRHYGQEMVKMLLNNQKFKKLLEQSLSTHDLEDILTRIKKKEYCPAVKPCGAERSLGMENQKGECPSVKNLVKKRNDGSKNPQATSPSSKWVKSTSDGRLLHRSKAQVTLPAAVEEMEPLQKLYHLLQAKGFQTRMEGVALLLDLSKTKPRLISTNIVQIFDYFVLTILDTHKKVKQKALDVLAEIIGLLEDALNPVIIRLVEGITKNLNSKDPGVHATAVNALEESPF
ncbi:TOG array regulator of axonemal microtubules protein 2-like [Anomalospiza imberbis]|uniref:TOG array regulator of axonemal microtubules protein 2-like n=1 Tax=Anomalospiza imberbis TaxID=187417 RepID=UPI0035900D8D